MLRAAFDGQPIIDIGRYRFLVNSITEQTPPTTAELLRAAGEALLAASDLTGVTKLCGEEDRGGILIAAASLLSGLPFGMARWSPAGVGGQIQVPFECEYTSGALYLNGIEPGDRVLILDDMISSGGTLVALIQAVRLAGAQVADAVCLAEKMEYGGVARVQAETGITVKTLLQVSVTGERSRVL